MPIVDIFSRRKARASKAVQDVYQYEEIPVEFRVQIVHILGDCLGHLSDEDVQSLTGYSMLQSYAFDNRRERYIGDSDGIVLKTRMF